MTSLNYKVSSEVIRKANRTLIAQGTDGVSYSGTITVRYVLNGVEKVKEISEADINKAYGKALDTYGKKL